VVRYLIIALPKMYYTKSAGERILKIILDLERLEAKVKFCKYRLTVAEEYVWVINKNNYTYGKVTSQ